MKKMKWLLTPMMLLALAACGGGGGGSAPTTLTQRTRTPAPQPSPTVQPPPPTSSTGAVTFSNLEGMRMSARAAVADNPREDYMLACTVQLRNGNECSLLTLPLIGMEFADPDVEDIMSRVSMGYPIVVERIDPGTFAAILYRAFELRR